MSGQDCHNWTRRQVLNLDRALTQDQHAAVNAQYPGFTRQHCFLCEAETGRCAEDEIRDEDDNGPYCENCWASRSVCSECEGGGWTHYGLASGGPYFKVCETCGNPESLKCP